jgi:hypothetical protein
MKTEGLEGKVGARRAANPKARTVYDKSGELIET